MDNQEIFVGISPMLSMRIWLIETWDFTNMGISPAMLGELVRNLGFHHKNWVSKIGDMGLGQYLVPIILEGCQRMPMEGPRLARGGISPGTRIQQRTGHGRFKYSL